MAIQELNKTEVAAVSGGAISISGLVSGLPLVGGLLSGVLGVVTGLVNTVVGVASGLPVVGSLLGTVLGLVSGIVTL